MSEGTESFFLYRVAKDLWERWGKEGLQHSAVFLPSSRSKLFLIRYLYQLAGNRALVLPRWSSVCTEAERIAQVEVVDPLLLLPKVFNLYREKTNTPEDREIPFDEFYPWGMTILRDFDQIDKYQVDAENLFTDLQNVAKFATSTEILTDSQRKWLENFYKVNKSSRSALEERYLRIWDILYPIYNELQNYIDKQKEGYEGAVIRNAITKIDKTPSLVRDEKVKHYAVIGFNALTSCEVAYFKTLKNEAGDENVLFYWDYPESTSLTENGEYTTSEKDAGYFIRSHSKVLGDAMPRVATTRRPEVEIIAAPSVLTQADVVRELLPELGENKHAVLILPDEQLLLPVLQSLPKELELNITMGYPLRNTLVALLLENLLLWLASYVEEKEVKTSSCKHLKTLLLHPFLQQDKKLESTIKKVETHTDDKINHDELKDTPVEEWMNSLKKNGLPQFLLNFLKELGDRLNFADPDENNAVPDAERRIWCNYMIEAYTVISELQQVLLRANIDPTVKLLRRILPKLFRDKKIAYYGEPLSGLQIMGFLETRCLNFDEVIILSCNEGILPAVRNTPSFIMSSIAKVYKLPTLQERELMYAYYFQTIVACAKRVRLIYAKTDGAGGGIEPSRYVLQYKYLLPNNGEKQPQICDFSFAPNNNPNSHEYKPYAVEKKSWKTEFEAYCEHGISPSALSTYCYCPLSFFYQYIAHIEEPPETEHAEMSALDFGTWVHDSLQELYESVKNQYVTKKALDDLSSQVRKVVERQYERIKGDAPLNGIQKIERDLVSKILEDCVELDKSRIPFKLCDLEHEIKTELKLSNGSSIRLRGKVDRIDKCANEYYIIDYKTGKYKRSHATFTSVDSLFDGSAERDYVFQTFFYAYLLTHAHYKVDDDKLRDENAIPALWFVMEAPNTQIEIVYKEKREETAATEGGINASKEDQPPRYSTFAKEFATSLQQCLEHLLDSENFDPTAEIKRCAICSYQLLCWGAKGC